MKIQFVCTGNTFRSRISEAYLKSKDIPGLIVSSSGIEAQKNLNGPVCDVTVHLLEDHHLVKYLSKTWKATQKEELESQDLVVFMDKIHFEYSYGVLHCHIPNYETWDIPDITKEISGEQIFQRIKEKVDLLIIHKIKLI